MVKMNKEFENFDAAMRKLMSVPHDRIKAELDAEKAAKASRRAKSGASTKKKATKDRSK